MQLRSMKHKNHTGKEKHAEYTHTTSDAFLLLNDHYYNYVCVYVYVYIYIWSPRHWGLLPHCGSNPAQQNLRNKGKQKP